MPTLHIETWIAAPAEICFDLARSVEAHTALTAKTNERAVSLTSPDGASRIASGLIGLGRWGRSA